jgi:prepilin-type N-terminal cleavage/methylation domain-containing protein
MRTATHTDGFTLLEIMVVLGLLGLTLLLSVPRFGHGLTTDPGLRAARWILHTADSLKRAAVADQRLYVLQIDIPANRLWVTCETEACAPPSGKGGIELQGGATLLDVEFPGQAPPTLQTARIRFFPQGYSDRAVIHLALEDHRRLSFPIEPFIARTRLLETDTGFAR